MMILVQFRNAENKATLRNATDFVRGDIRRVITSAQSGKKQQNESSAGYGIVFDNTTPSQYFLYTKKNTTDDYVYNAKQDTIMETVKLHAIGIQNISIKCGPNQIHTSQCDLFIESDTQFIWINGERTDENITITMSRDNTLEEKKIILDRATGRIDES